MSDGASLTTISAQPHPHPPYRKTHPTFHFLAGLTSGVCSAVLLQPADLLKTRVQQSLSSSLVPVLRSALAGPSPVQTLWRGTVPSAVRTGFGSALYFTTLSTLRQLVASRTALSPTATRIKRNGYESSSSTSALPKLSPTANLLTGATARVMAGLVLMPVTVIKVRYESDLYSYKSLPSAARSIYKIEGMRGFFTGLGATAVRDAPYAGLYVVFYEAGKSWLGNLAMSTSGSETKVRDKSGSLSATINATSGVLAAASATAITNPFDAVKTRIQLMPAKYRNMARATRLMLQEEGLKSFFNGLGLRMGRKAISSALAWTVYEELIRRAETKLVQQDASAATAVI